MFSFIIYRYAFFDIYQNLYQYNRVIALLFCVNSVQERFCRVLI